MITKLITQSLKNKKISKIDGFCVVTDKVEYDKQDQVFPLHPENQFFLDEIVKGKVKGAKVLEIGIGSGVLSISVVKAGAKKVLALEINPKAKIYAGFNILLNGYEDKIEIKDGNAKEIFSPVKGKKFDYIISNPPFEPTPLGINYYLHSSGGIFGLDFVEKILKDLDNYLTDNGHAQIVTFATGDKNHPFVLKDLVEKYLSGKSTIKVNPTSMKFDDFADRFTEIGKATKEQITWMKKQAAKNGVSHIYLCMLHYEKGKKQVKLIPAEKEYKNWDLPLNSNVPMGYADRQGRKSELHVLFNNELKGGDKDGIFI